MNEDGQIGALLRRLVEDEPPFTSALGSALTAEAERRRCRRAALRVAVVVALVAAVGAVLGLAHHWQSGGGSRMTSGAAAVSDAVHRAGV